MASKESDVDWESHFKEVSIPRGRILYRPGRPSDLPRLLLSQVIASRDPRLSPSLPHTSVYSRDFDFEDDGLAFEDDDNESFNSEDWFMDPVSDDFEQQAKQVKVKVNINRKYIPEGEQAESRENVDTSDAKSEEKVKNWLKGSSKEEQRRDSIQGPASPPRQRRESPRPVQAPSSPPRQKKESPRPVPAPRSPPRQRKESPKPVQAPASPPIQRRQSPKPIREPGVMPRLLLQSPVKVHSSSERRREVLPPASERESAIISSNTIQAIASPPFDEMPVIRRTIKREVPPIVPSRSDPNEGRTNVAKDFLESTSVSNVSDLPTEKKFENPQKERSVDNDQQSDSVYSQDSRRSGIFQHLRPLGTTDYGSRDNRSVQGQSLDCQPIEPISSPKPKPAYDPTKLEATHRPNRSCQFCPISGYTKRSVESDCLTRQTMMSYLFDHHRRDTFMELEQACKGREHCKYDKPYKHFSELSLGTQLESTFAESAIVKRLHFANMRDWMARKPLDCLLSGNNREAVVKPKPIRPSLKTDMNYNRCLDEFEGEIFQMMSTTNNRPERGDIFPVPWNITEEAVDEVHRQVHHYMDFLSKKVMPSLISSSSSRDRCIKDDMRGVPPPTSKKTPRPVSPPAAINRDNDNRDLYSPTRPTETAYSPSRPTEQDEEVEDGEIKKRRRSDSRSSPAKRHRSEEGGKKKREEKR